MASSSSSLKIWSLVVSFCRWLCLSVNHLLSQWPEKVCVSDCPYRSLFLHEKWLFSLSHLTHPQAKNLHTVVECVWKGVNRFRTPCMYSHSIDYSTTPGGIWGDPKYLLFWAPSPPKMSPLCSFSRRDEHPECFSSYPPRGRLREGSLSSLSSPFVGAFAFIFGELACSESRGGT